MVGRTVAAPPLPANHCAYGVTASDREVQL